MNIKKTLHSALDFYQRGDFMRAEEISKKILRKKPNCADALHLLGMIYFQWSDYEPAINYIRRALDINPHSADAFNNLANIYQATGQLDKAILYYEKALQINPDMTGTQMNLGIVLQDAGKLNEAISRYQKVIQLNPNHYGAYNNLGLALHRIGKIDDAIDCYRNASRLNPSFAEAYNNLGLILKEEGYIDEAIETYQKALKINSNYRDAHTNLGGAYQAIGLVSQAISSYQKALALDSHYVRSYNYIGTAYTDSGDSYEAEKYFRRALQIQSDYSTAYSNILLSMHYDERNSPEVIFSEHLQFADRFEKPLIADRLPYLNKRTPDCRLRIGYVSPDFRRHSVAYFIEPILAAHHYQDCEILCYADIRVPDEVTKRLQGYVDGWYPIVGQSDGEVAELIRRHHIDILVDLAGHTANNRMLMFSRKPAPIQISWIGYPATTGLSSMDYKIVDNYTDPPGLTEQFYTEKLLRLPGAFLCFLPDKDSPDVSPPPALSTGNITFGSFNNFSKLSHEILRVWQTILKKIPTARLIIKAKSLADTSLKNHVFDLFQNEGITKNQLELLSWSKTPYMHLELYSHIDIALDTFPYHGTATTCEALWMGVPVITLAGTTHASRVGVSLLSNIGLPELVAYTPESYIEKAINLAHDTKQLCALRQQLRGMMLQAPLTDKELFTLTLEEYYRKIWKRFCNEY